MSGLAKRLLVWITAFVLLFILGIILCNNYNVVKEPQSHSGTLKDVTAIISYVKKLNEIYPADIIIYGTDVKFENELTVRSIDEITAEKLVNDKQFHFLIINDVEEKAPLKEEQISLILDYVYHKEYNIYYIGTRYGEIIARAAKEEGAFQMEPGAVQEAKRYSFILIHNEHGVTSLEDVWGEFEQDCYAENQEILGDILLSSMSHVAEAMEGAREN